MSTDALVSVDGGQATFEPLALYKSVVALTDADIKALPTTPVELIAAPGAGLTIVPLMVLAKMETEAGAYTNLDATSCTIYTQLGNTFSTTSYDENAYNALGSPTAGTVIVFTPYAAVAGGVVAAAALAGPLADEALMLVGDNAAAGNWTGGNAANTITVTTIYAVLTP